MPPEARTVFAADYARDPFAVLAELRHDGVVHRIVSPDGPPAWLVTRYAEVQAALADPRLSLNNRYSHGRDYLGFSLPPELSAHLLNTDPPQHTRLRKAIAPTFTARRVSSLAAGVEAVVTELVQELASGPDGTADLVSGLAARVPARIISEMLDLPTPARDAFQQWADRLLPRDGQERRARDTLGEMAQIIHTAVTTPPPNTEQTLLSDLLSAHSEGQLDRDELTSMVFYLLFVWHEILINALGSGLLRTLTYERRGELADDRDLMDHLVDEVLRYDSPQLLAAPRFPMDDLELGGVRIAAGDTVLLSLAAANRDGAAFTDADRFDPSRRPNPHLALGHGPHSCPAAAFTRLTLRTTMAVLLRSYPTSRLAVDPEKVPWRDNGRHRGPGRLPVELRG